MNKTLKKIAFGLFLALVALALPSLSQAQQNYLIQTTLTAAVPAPASLNLAAPVPYSGVSVASSTGISGILGNQTATINQQTSWQIYVDRELMQVVQVNGNVLQVQRGVGGTVATAHASGAMVLAGRAYWFNVSDPGVSSTPQGTNAPANSPCVLANVIASPWVNVRSGNQWVCNPNSLTWQAGFGSPYIAQNSAMATVASVAGATNVSFPTIKISGTNAITSWTFTGNGAIGVCGVATANSCMTSFSVIPTGTWTTTATNNIGAVISAVVGQVQVWNWNAVDGKWYVQP